MVMIGDHKQLGPNIKDHYVLKLGLNKSIFDRLIRINNNIMRVEI